MHRCTGYWLLASSAKASEAKSYWLLDSGYSSLVTRFLFLVTDLWFLIPDLWFLIPDLWFLLGPHASLFFTSCPVPCALLDHS
jgi:hypothetical protein